jgi:ubiquinone/menaquinone biosynthesis C-methylase UbiE
MMVLEPGPGMGFFTLEAARLVGPKGRVVAVDLQPRMLQKLRRRAAKAGLAERIEVRLAPADRMGVDDLKGQVDLALAFWMVHELPDPGRFFAECHGVLKAGGRLLLAEPRRHVTAEEYLAQLQAAGQVGLRLEGRPVIRWSRSALLVKT